MADSDNLLALLKNQSTHIKALRGSIEGERKAKNKWLNELEKERKRVRELYAENVKLKSEIVALKSGGGQ